MDSTSSAASKRMSIVHLSILSLVILLVDVHQLDPEGCLVSNDTLLNIRRKSGISMKIVDSTPLEQIETQEHVQWLDRFTEESVCTSSLLLFLVVSNDSVEWQRDQEH